MGDMQRLVNRDQSEAEQGAAWRDEQDTLLRRLETAHDLPPWVWGQLTETLAGLRELPDGLQWAGVRYLQCVLHFGPSMFSTVGTQQHLLPHQEPSDDRPVDCSCGGATGPVPRRSGWRRTPYRCGRCLSCGYEVVEWLDESPL